MSVEALNETLGIEVGPMDRVSVTVAAPDTIRSWSRVRLKSRDNQLSNIQARTRRSVLPKNLWTCS